MKTCVCGYKKSDSWDDEESCVGHEDFIELKGAYFIENPSSYYSDTKEVHILACPKCGTLKIV